LQAWGVGAVSYVESVEHIDLRSNGYKSQKTASLLSTLPQEGVQTVSA